MSIAASRMQQRRLDQERVFNETRAFLSDQEKIERRHDWENRTQKQIELQEANARKQKLLQQEQEEVNKRKQELQSLYNDEMQQWKQTLQSSLEVSQEEKMESIRRRAYQLKDKRERERQAFVAECYERQWVDACDELREFDSNQTLNRLTKDRALVIEKNRARAMEEQSNNAQQNDDDTSYVMSLINKDESHEQECRRQKEYELKRALDHQVQMQQSQAEHSRRKKQIEEKQQLSQLAMLEQEAKELDKELIGRSKQQEGGKEEGYEMLQELGQRANERKNKEIESRKQNLILLQHAMDIEKSQVDAERAKKEFGKEAASDFVQCLQEQSKVEEKENNAVNMIRNNELERVAKMNDDNLLADAEMKRRWQQQVDETRQEQIQRKQVEATARLREMKEEVKKVSCALKEADDAERRDLKQAKLQTLDVYNENKRVMEQKAREREQRILEKRNIALAEKQRDEEFRDRMEKYKCGHGGVSELL